MPLTPIVVKLADLFQTKPGARPRYGYTADPSWWLRKAYTVIAVDNATGERVVVYGSTGRQRMLNLQRRPLEVNYDSREHDLGRLVELLA